MDLWASLFAATAVFIIAWVSLRMRPPVIDRPAPEKKDLLTVMIPVLRVVSLPTRALVWGGYRRWAQSKLDAAGMRPYLTVDEFFAARLVLVAGAWIFTLAYPDSLRLLFIGFAIVFPEMWVMSLIRVRHAEIRRTMPYFTDLLAMCTGAGLDFGAAIDRVLSRSEEGPLVQELRLARRDNALGKSQQEALINMAARVQLPELTSFTAIIVQAMRMGATVTEILEAQAQKMRIERYEKAERLGTEAQQKILLPLLLLILPAFVILGIIPLIMAMAQPIIQGGLFNGTEW